MPLRRAHLRYHGRTMGIASLLLVLSALPVQDDATGSIRAKKWHNWIGAGPTLEDLEGRTVLLHFFVTEKPKSAGFLTLCKFHNEYAEKGLVIIALTPDSPERVARLLGDFPLPFAVGAGSDVGSEWGIHGKYGQVIVDPRGEVFYRGDIYRMFGPENDEIMARDLDEVRRRAEQQATRS